MLHKIGLDKETLIMIINLCKLDFKVKAKESMLGLFWYMIWPIIQSGGYVIIFNIIKNPDGLSPEVFSQFLIILIWSQVVLTLIYSFNILSINVDIIKNLVFPYYNSISSEIVNKFLFFIVTFLPLVFFYALINDHLNIFFIINTLIFCISILLLLISICWFGSIIGMIFPDISGILVILSTFLIAFSKLFLPEKYYDLGTLSIFLELNPVNFFINIFQALFVNQISFLICCMFLVCFIFYVISLKSIKFLLQEIIKLI